MTLNDPSTINQAWLWILFIGLPTLALLFACRGYIARKLF